MFDISVLFSSVLLVSSKLGHHHAVRTFKRNLIKFCTKLLFCHFTFLVEMIQRHSHQILIMHNILCTLSCVKTSGPLMSMLLPSEQLFLNTSSSSFEVHWRHVSTNILGHLQTKTYIKLITIACLIICTLSHILMFSTSQFPARNMYCLFSTNSHPDLVSYTYTCNCNYFMWTLVWRWIEYGSKHVANALTRTESNIKKQLFWWQ